MNPLASPSSTTPLRKSGLVRREFLETLGAGALAATLAHGGRAADLLETRKPWQPFTDRKVRVGIVGYGVCRFGAEFGFQDHPNVEIVAVSDLFPDRRDGLMKTCRCFVVQTTLPSTLYVGRGRNSVAGGKGIG